MMCTVSMVGDDIRDRWSRRYPWIERSPQHPEWPNVPLAPNSAPQEVSKQEFDALKREVEDLKALLARAKKYDEDNGEPDCEMDEKVALIKKVADLVGVDLSEIFGAG